MLSFFAFYVPAKVQIILIVLVSSLKLLDENIANDKSFHLLKISAKSETNVMKENPRKRLRVPPNSATRVVQV